MFLYTAKYTESQYDNNNILHKIDPKHQNIFEPLETFVNKMKIELFEVVLLLCINSIIHIL